MSAITNALDALTEAVELLRDALTGDEPADQPTGELRPPSRFSATWDPGTRRITCRWEPSDDVVEVHEFDTDPANTLKATFPAGGAGVRVSTPLAGGHTYTYALRTVRGALTSAFTHRIRFDVPAKAGDTDEPEQPDDPGTDEPAPGGPHPSDVLPAMRTWTLTRPTGSEGDPDNDYLVGETLPGLCFVRGDLGVAFVCPAGGVTTENSNYPRDELREMADNDWTKAKWSSSKPHELEFDMSIDASDLTQRPRVVGAQIHGGGDDVCQLMRHETAGLVLMHSDGDTYEVIDPDYQDGQRFTGRIVVVPRPDDEDNDLIQVWYEDSIAAEIEARGDSWYFKAGAYVQSSPEKWGEHPDAIGEVVIYRLIAGGDPLA